MIAFITAPTDTSPEFCTSSSRLTVLFSGCKLTLLLHEPDPTIRCNSVVSCQTHQLTWLTLTLPLPSYPKTTVLTHRTLGALRHHRQPRTPVLTNPLRDALQPCE
nr:MAG: hypothetical protein EDM05_33395 [Leptolyngbya sp. IPPAS B-1204]